MRLFTAMPKGYEVTMDVNGRLYIPKSLRRKLNLKGKEGFEVFLTEGDVILFKLVS